MASKLVLKGSGPTNDGTNFFANDTFTLTIKNPKPGLTPAQFQTAYNSILKTGGFLGNGVLSLNGAALTSAKRVDETVTVFDTTPTI